MGSRERKLGVGPVQRRWFLVGVKLDPDRDTRRDDEQALEEIRLLFVRCRQTARHGQVTERGEPATAPAGQPAEAARLSEG
jgi:hypothetical protein